MSPTKWIVKWDPRALEDMKSFSSRRRLRIFAYLENTIHEQSSPHIFCQALSGNKADLCRYRVGVYRIICCITDAEVTVLAVVIGHKQTVYLINFRVEFPAACGGTWVQGLPWGGAKQIPFIIIYQNT